jgi:hypothetical protein
MCFEMPQRTLGEVVKVLTLWHGSGKFWPAKSQKFFLSWLASPEVRWIRHTLKSRHRIQGESGHRNWSRLLSTAPRSNRVRVRHVVFAGWAARFLVIDFHQILAAIWPVTRVLTRARHRRAD